MKKFTLLFLIFAFLILLVGCNNNEKTQNETKTSVVINMPADSTVNGYRISTPETDNTSSGMPDKINGSDTIVQSNKNSTSEISNSKTYCGNKNSKVFHFSTCASVSKMKDENKVFSSNRSELISQGYTPCGRCKP